jgi:alkane 1-monooxygenase
MEQASALQNAQSAAPNAVTESISIARAWFLHLWSFVLPLITLAFLLTGPHSWWSALLWTMPLWTLVYIDNHAPADHRQPPASMPRLPFNLIVYGLTALQIANHVMLGVMGSKLVAEWSIPAVIALAANAIAVSVMCGTTAGYSGIVVAHELVHRRNPIEYFFGRVLLMGVLYEQFATEHVRGHHPRIGTFEDPATARFGERHADFVRRSIPAQFKSAWKLEKVRLGNPEMSNFNPRMVQHRVFQGVVAEIGILVAFWYFFGWVALGLFIVQSRTAVILLETVNYIEHWGLSRKSGVHGLMGHGQLVHAPHARRSLTPR